MPDPILLILDLDETLLHATATRLDVAHDFQVFQYFVYKRPGLDAFLRAVSRDFRLAVWSSASDDYVQAIVAAIFPPAMPLEFVWGRSRCTPIVEPPLDEDGYHYPDYGSHYSYAKRLQKVRRRGYDLRRVLIVDDTPAKVRQHYGNAIYATPFEGQPGDQELPRLAEYLRTLRGAENVRIIEKRGWRD